MDVELTEDERGELVGDCKQWYEIPYKVKNAQIKKFVEYLDGFKCDECETPDFISLVLPKRIWLELKNIGGNDART